MAGSLGDLVVSIKADYARFQSDMGKIRQETEASAKAMSLSLQSINGAVNGVIGGIGKISSTLTLITAGAGFASIIKQAVDWNLQTKALANNMGITTEQASIMEVALGHLGLSNEQAEQASLRLSKALASGTDKFDQYGIKVKDTNTGALLPMPQIMANVNKAILETQSGVDRNIIAMDLYGKSWKEIQGILKLTPEQMEEAAQKAKDLHLIVGDEGVAQARRYKESLNDVGLVGKSLSVQFGNVLLPMMVEFGAYVGKNSDVLSTTFAYSLQFVTKLAQTAGEYVGLMAYRIYSMGAIAKDVFTGNWGEIKKDWANMVESGKDFTKRANERWTTGWGIQKPKASSKVPEGDKLDIGDSEEAQKAQEDYERQVKAAQDAYMRYEKVFEETKVAAIKSANDMALELNKEAYDKGLIDQKTYQDTRLSLTLSSMQAELDAKKKELSDAQAAEKTALAAYDKDPTGDTAKNVNEAYAKTQSAIKAVATEQSKMDLARVQGVENTRKENETTLNGYTQLRSEVISMAGDYVGAEKLKQEAEKNTESYRQLVRNALAGDAASQRALADKQKKWAADNYSASVKAREETLAHVNSIAKLQSEYDQLLGKDQSVLNAEKNLRDGLQAEHDLQVKLNEAQENGRTRDIALMQQEIALQKQKNGLAEKELDDLMRKKVLSGDVIGFDASKVDTRKTLENGTTNPNYNPYGAIYADEYKKFLDAMGYKTDKELQAADKNGDAASRAQAAGQTMQAAGNAMIQAADLQKETVTGYFKFANPDDAKRSATSIVGARSATSLQGMTGWSAQGFPIIKLDIPSYDVGTDFIPHDMIAQVHKGERIVTAADNASGNFGGSTTVHAPITINGTNMTPDEMMRAVLVPLKKAMGRFG